ncbi:serine/threonine protein kinase [Roseofilum sp. BLCC_M154]|uniref:Serine/threonine protein kinase n=1 Tax=Roseofilum acuticapitatum BLCC-M154 TaxID=3022444 RepID=A0ABT7AW47_9CYAN|nr:serine/threonine-protein kinase [Roseofilum acuticapitatum]MDJ1171138.1 serine/threonine protein kinase [Roseofilum acuticapitatum BLCC-M154]
MRYCLNPDCKQPKNPDGNAFCQSCRSALLLKDRYKALKCIGQGGFGRTFLGIDQDKPSQPYCVIKQFFPQAQGTNNVQKATQLFEQEAVRLDDLGQHAQIPALYAHFTQDSRQYLVQEFIDGENLSQVLEKTGIFNENQIRELLYNLLPVLDFIHHHHVIHRDIKPENIILRENGQLVLVDFGAAKYATSTALLKTGTTIGTPEYLAPEQGRGRAVFSSDLYSLGVTCLHMLTGKSPFELFDIHEDTWIWRQGLGDNPMSEPLAKIIDRLIAAAINHRYHSAQEVLRDLQGLPTLDPSVNSIKKTTTIQPVVSPLASPSLPSTPSSSEWQCVHTLSGHTQWVRAVAIHPNSRVIASGSEDRAIRFWDGVTGQHEGTLKRHALYVNAVAFSPNGRFLATGGDDCAIYVWDLQQGEWGPQLGESHTEDDLRYGDAINAIAWNPQGTLLASASKDRTVKIWQLDPKAPRYGEAIFTLTGHLASVRAVSFSPDGRIIASGSDDNTIKLWHLGREVEFATLGDLASRLNIVNALAFSPDGQWLASGGWDNLVKLWDFETGKTMQVFEGHQDYVRSLAFSPDGQLLVSGSDDRTLKIWQVKTATLLTTLEGHQNSVNGVAWSADGQIIVSASADKTLKVWQGESRQPQIQDQTVQQISRSTPVTPSQPKRPMYRPSVHQPWLD